MLGAIQAAGGHELRVLVPCAAPSGQAGHVGVPLIEQAMTGHNPGATPLYAAACGGSLRCAKLLCEAGAKIDARTQNDASPLLVSCQVRARQRTQHRPHSGPEAPPRHPT
jgi:ankyrin repeat protein